MLRKIFSLIGGGESAEVEFVQVQSAEVRSLSFREGSPVAKRRRLSDCVDQETEEYYESDQLGYDQEEYESLGEDRDYDLDESVTPLNKWCHPRDFWLVIRDQQNNLVGFEKSDGSKNRRNIEIIESDHSIMWRHFSTFESQEDSIQPVPDRFKANVAYKSFVNLFETQAVGVHIQNPYLGLVAIKDKWVKISVKEDS